MPEIWFRIGRIKLKQSTRSVVNNNGFSFNISSPHCTNLPYLSYCVVMCQCIICAGSVEAAPATMYSGTPAIQQTSQQVPQHPPM